MKNKKNHIASILGLQDAVARSHLLDDPKIKDRYQFCIECLNWSFVALGKEPEQNQRPVNTLLTDAFSSILVSINVGLRGTVTDALHVLRPALEVLAIADYVIEKKHFSILAYEFKNKKFKRLNFDRLKGVDLDKNLVKEHERISRMASHGTIDRINNGFFSLDGKTFRTIGVAYDPNNVKKIFGNIAAVSLYLTRIQVGLLPEDDPLREEHEALEGKYKSLS